MALLPATLPEIDLICSSTNGKMLIVIHNPSSSSSTSVLASQQSAVEHHYARFHADKCQFKIGILCLPQSLTKAHHLSLLHLYFYLFYTGEKKYGRVKCQCIVVVNSDFLFGMLSQPMYMLAILTVKAFLLL